MTRAGPLHPLRRSSLSKKWEQQGKGPSDSGESPIVLLEVRGL